jgi:membrane protease YdiL (CAAX protease family)
MTNNADRKFMQSTGAGSNIPAAAYDLFAILGTLFAVKSTLLLFDSLWSYAGPISLLSALAVASWCLYRRGGKWADLGLKKPESISKMLMWSLVAFVVTMAVGILANSAVTAVFSGDLGEIDPRYRNRFANVPGNAMLYTYWIVVAWVVGAFAEEMLFRAMLISRFEQLLSKFRYAPVMAVMLQSVIFGQQHFYYQGLSGAFATGAIALVSGAFYLLLKRRLWPLILSHGLANMLGLTLIYTGVQPPG